MRKVTLAGQYDAKSDSWLVCFPLHTRGTATNARMMTTVKVSDTVFEYLLHSHAAVCSAILVQGLADVIECRLLPLKHFSVHPFVHVI